MELWIFGDLIIQNTKKFSYSQIVKENFGFILTTEDSNPKNIFTKMISSEIPVFTNNNELGSQPQQNKSTLPPETSNTTNDLNTTTASSQNENNQSEATRK